MYGLALLGTCSISAALGFYTGSAKEGKRLGNALDASPRVAAGMTGKAPSSRKMVNDVSAVAAASTTSVPSAQESPQRIHSAAAVSSSASAGASTVSGASAPVVVSSASMTPVGGAGSMSSAGLIPEVPDAPKIMIPLVFQNINPAALGLNSTQVASINQMRSDFNTQLGVQQNPADPQYAQNWESAQAQADDRLRALLGWDQFNLYQINAAKRR